MVDQKRAASRSAFSDAGMDEALESLMEEVQELYLADQTPWVIGYSGGKDSTAVVQVTWNAILKLPPEKRHKPVYVITTDTMVENPIVAAWVEGSLKQLGGEARKVDMPFTDKLLYPETEDSFWVNLIGKGYPAPRHKFRWCTERLKIKPTSLFIENAVSEYGEVVLLIGARQAESTRRAASLKSRKKTAVRDRLTNHPKLTNCLVYTPIEYWTDDDVWAYLLQKPNPWGTSNKDLMAMYRGATGDNECPVVVDTSTESCGNSRFGCWVCTLVNEDKSMTAMIRNDHEKEWMSPLLEIRNELDFRGDDAHQRDQENRDFRRLTGRLHFFEKSDKGESKLIRGPYTQNSRKEWLRRVLEAQEEIRTNKATPEHVKDIELIRIAELEEIRRIWVYEKHEIEDWVPVIYKEATGRDFPGPKDENLAFDNNSLELLEEACAGEEGSALMYEMVRNLLTIEHQYRNKSVRRGLFEDLEKAIARSFFKDEEDAKEWAQMEFESKKSHFDELGQLVDDEAPTKEPVPDLSTPSSESEKNDDS